MDFLKNFEKELNEIKGITRSSIPPRYWISFGNYSMNKIMSDSYVKGIPQGRITGLVGPSGAGKSFIAGNLIKAAQQDGTFVLVIDSENALDDEYMNKIGVDTTNNYSYVSAITINQVTKVVSSFTKGYRQQYGDDEEAPKVLIVIDSLAMLLTESEEDNYEKGVQKGGQGQMQKQIKHMLKTFVQDIKDLNISMVCTGHVYENQDKLNGEGRWIVNQSMRFALSQIILLTKLKLRDKKTGESEGILLKCEGFKTRFAKPFQTVAIKVPYDTGIQAHSGLLSEDGKVGIAEKAGVVIKRGSRKQIVGEEETWYAKDITQDQINKILKLLEGTNVDMVGAIKDDDEDESQNDN